MRGSGRNFMNRVIAAASLLALGAGIAAPSFSYPGDESWGSPALESPYPPGYGQAPPGFEQYPPRGGFRGDGFAPPFGPYGWPQESYPSPAAARPSAPNYMPHASAPDTPSAIEAARRLYAVADTVAVHGAPLCGTRVRSQIGLRTWSRESLGPQVPQ